jgi:hypothetical protein
MKNYAPVFNESAMLALLKESARERRRLLDFVDRLAGELERGADFHETSQLGQVFYVAYHDDWLVTYWPDHAVKELRVVEVERAYD